MKIKLVLSLIIFIGILVRIAVLEVSPPGFNADEAALGYNAYSILKTGKDEWGEPFPLFFKSFSDYKPGLYVYLDIPFIAILGLNELAVRLPSIILGTLSILLIYFLSKKFFESEIVGLATAFLLAISPWHIHFSRGAWETNIATFFVLAGILTFIKGLKRPNWFLISVICFVLSMYAYQSTRLVTPVLGLFLVTFYWKQILIKRIIAPAILGVILMLPLVLVTFSTGGQARFKGISIFSDIGPLNKVNEERGEHQDPKSIQAKIYHNKVIAYSLNYLGHYADHYTPSFLFTNGDPLARNKVPEMGQMYLFEVLTLLAGIYFLLTKKFSNTKIIFAWLLIAPIAASLTYQTPHALRAHNMVIPLTLISGLGFGLLIEKINQKAKQFKYPVIGVSILVVVFLFSKFLHQYFVHLPKQYALEWEYGFSQLVSYIKENQDRYEKIVTTLRYDQPYILYLFYLQYDPAKYQQMANPTSIDHFGFSTIASFDKFEFRNINDKDITERGKNLLVGTKDELQDEQQIKIIYFPNGNEAFRIIETNE